MEHSVIVGFGYRARSGKDQAAEAIIAARSGKIDVRKYSFGQTLKAEVNAAAEAAGGMLELFKQGGVTENGKFYPFEFTTVTEQTKNLPYAQHEYKTIPVKYDPSPDMSDPLCPLGKQRELLQWWGTEFRRAQDQNYWVEKLAAIIEAERPTVALVVDVRFPNEVSWIKSSRDSWVVRVDRLGYRSTIPDHPSEHALDFMDDGDWSAILQVPDGELEELQRDSVVLFDLVIDQLTPPDLSDVSWVENGVVKVAPLAS